MESRVDGWTPCEGLGCGHLNCALVQPMQSESELRVGRSHHTSSRMPGGETLGSRARVISDSFLWQREMQTADWVAL